jgi:hypothetical protein
MLLSLLLLDMSADSSIVRWDNMSGIIFNLLGIY